MRYGVNNPREQQKLNEFYHYESAQLTALRALNAELVAALQDIVREPQGKTVADNAKVLSAVIRIARAALAKAGAA